MFQGQLVPRPPSFRGSLKALEADINHANTLAGAVQRAYGGACLQMRLSCSPLAPFFLHLIQWLDCTCYALTSHLGLFQVLVYKVYVDGVTTISTFERRASIREFYGIIYPSLQQLEGNLTEREPLKEKGRAKEIVGRKRAEEWKKLFDKDLDRDDDECGICLEVCTKMVLPNCNHALCMKCYRDWNVRSQSCPFCRGSIKRVRSRDLWVLTNKSDVADTMTLEIDNLKRFYQYIDSLPLIIPDTLFLVYYDYVV